jgi:hypothetical protein
MRKTTATLALGAMLTGCAADVTELDEMSGMDEEQTGQSESEETTEEAVQECAPSCESSDERQHSEGYRYRDFGGMGTVLRPEL